MRTLLDRILGRNRDNPIPSVPVVEVVEPPKPRSKYDDFSVEHYPLTGKFFPKCGRMYMKRGYHTGIYELQKPEYFMYADSARTEDDAWKIVDLYMEQQLKQNVKVLTRD